MSSVAFASPSFELGAGRGDFFKGGGLIMWIRGQGRCDLVNAYKVAVYIDKILVNEDFCVGTYNSVAEAITVLDAIQKNIETIENFRSLKEFCPYYVFQMPEAGFLDEES